MNKMLRSLPVGAATALSAAAFAAYGIVELVQPQSSAGSRVVGFAGHAILALLALGLLALAPLLAALAHETGSAAARRAANGAIAGTAALAAASLIALGEGHDPSFFNAVAALGNLLWLGGLLALAVAARRARALPRLAAVALPLTWLLSIPAATVGGSIAAAALLLAVGRFAAAGGAGRAGLATEAGSASGQTLPLVPARAAIGQ